jgi:hypothetical protein
MNIAFHTTPIPDSPRAWKRVVRRLSGALLNPLVAKISHLTPQFAN